MLDSVFKVCGMGIVPKVGCMGGVFKVGCMGGGVGYMRMEKRRRPAYLIM